LDVSPTWRHAHGKPGALSSGDRAGWPAAVGWEQRSAAARRSSGSWHGNQSARLVDVSSNVQIELTGKDAPAFLNRLCTQQVDRLPPGSGCEAFVTNARGHIMAHVLVFCGIQSRLLHASGVRAAKIREHLQQYLVRDQVEIHDRGGEWCEFRLAGKQAESLLTEMTSAPIPAADLEHANVALAESEVSVRRHALGDVPGFLISANADLAGSVGNALRQAGARPCNPLALESHCGPAKIVSLPLSHA